MQLDAFFGSLNGAQGTLDHLKQAGFHIDAASIHVGDGAWRRLRQCIAAERRRRSLNCALGGGSAALIGAGLLMPSRPRPSEWLLEAFCVFICMIIGATAGAIFGQRPNRNTVWLEINVAKTHAEEATAALRASGAWFVTTRTSRTDSIPRSPSHPARAEF